MKVMAKRARCQRCWHVDYMHEDRTGRCAGKLSGPYQRSGLLCGCVAFVPEEDNDE
ncbi:MAG: hypothetical protein ACOC9T_02045 [Myxococcota bacterium]